MTELRLGGMKLVWWRGVSSSVGWYGALEAGHPRWPEPPLGHWGVRSSALVGWSQIIMGGATGFPSRHPTSRDVDRDNNRAAMMPVQELAMATTRSRMRASA